ncbi:MAG TPA: type II glyceraldehyde-3-phosphate dehydrogenase [Candidatus Thermoplasmatota archaeon]|jgi:glyceraldehyde-3-phosphate dehydrogenase (NAD(P))|nr:type II glyceraldehyde-3-phosphate dehydrogenase [Candidatus Thermoplasmatota archaeon]
MIKVAINGYGTIGKRVADAVAAQKDMKVIGVSKTRPNAEAFVAKQRGYPLYIADLSKRAAFEKVGLSVAGSVEEMCKLADIIVDATPGDIGATNKPLYEKLGKKALWQGGEEHEIAKFSFNSSCNYKDAIGRQFVRVVSCNTTGLCRIIHTIDKEYGVDHVHAIMVRRGSDPGEIKKGPIDAIVLDPVSVPSHHGPDVLSVLPHISITTMAMIVPTTMMHMHAIRITTRKEVTRERVIELVKNHPRMGLIKKSVGIRSTAELKEFAMDLGRSRSDLYENCIFEDSIYANKTDLCFFQAIHQEADVVVENIDAIRAMMGAQKDSATSIKTTNDALGFTPIHNHH